jgi:hypothetical protein
VSAEIVGDTGMLGSDTGNLLSDFITVEEGSGFLKSAVLGLNNDCSKIMSGVLLE